MKTPTRKLTGQALCDALRQRMRARYDLCLCTNHQHPDPDCFTDPLARSIAQVHKELHQRSAQPPQQPPLRRRH